MVTVPVRYFAREPGYVDWVMKLITPPSVLDLHLLASYKETSDTPVSQSYV